MGHARCGLINRSEFRLFLLDIFGPAFPQGLPGGAAADRDGKPAENARTRAAAKIEPDAKPDTAVPAASGAADTDRNRPALAPSVIGAALDIALHPHFGNAIGCTGGGTAKAQRGQFRFNRLEPEAGFEAGGITARGRNDSNRTAAQRDKAVWRVEARDFDRRSPSCRNGGRDGLRMASSCGYFSNFTTF